ncbi:hypothetical protein BGW80DRAFT_810161 [Lactifluus volemus]|nr:hypothetical protein BGW80DRAFT_810161 [Lactifluus volemus]
MGGGVYTRAGMVSFNISMPRLVSFTGHVIPHHRIPGKNRTDKSDKKRAAVFNPRVTYSFQIYLAYALYPALYIARPIITFNDFMWQLTKHIRNISRRGRRCNLRCASSSRFLRWGFSFM